MDVTRFTAEQARALEHARMVLAESPRTPENADTFALSASWYRALRLALRDVVQVFDEDPVVSNLQRAARLAPAMNDHRRAAGEDADADPTLAQDVLRVAVREGLEVLEAEYLGLHQPETDWAAEDVPEL
jgi:hypothetical protein